MYLSNNNINEVSIKTAEQFIANKIEGDSNFLVSSTEKISIKWNSKLLKETGKAFHSTDILSYRKFIKYLSNNYLKSDIIDELVENELIIKSIELSSSEKLKSKNYNYISQIASIIRGLREDGIRAKNLRDDVLDSIDKGKYDNERLDNLYSIMFAYENLLNDYKFYDYPSAMEVLASTFRQKKIFTDNNLLFIDFNSFRKPDLELFEALSEENVITINSRFSVEKGPFIGENNFFINDLLSMGFKPYSIDNKEIDEQNFNIDYGFDKSTQILAKDNSKKIEIYSYSNIREESYGITKLVKYLLLNKELGLRPSDICVVSRDVGSYSGLLREFFADNQIPTNITDRYELSKSPVINSIFNVLEAPINNFKLDSIRNIFNSAYLDVGIKEHKKLLHLAEKYKLIGGFPGKGITIFLTQLTTRINNLKNIIENTENNDYQLSKYRKQVNELENASEKFKLLEQKFTTIDNSKNYTIKEFKQLVTNIVNSFSIKKRILELTDWIQSEELTFNDKVFYTERVEKDSRALFKFFELLDKLSQLDRSISTNEKYSLEDILIKVKGIVSITRYQTREKKGYGVEVTSIEQTRGKNYRVRIMAGAIEGMMPLPFKTDKLIGKIIQDSERRHFFNEYVQFHDFINNDTKFYIFYHENNNDETNLESQFILPLIGLPNVVSYNENSNVNWQKSFINRRELILNGKILPSENLTKWMECYKNSEDLKIDSGFDTINVLEEINKLEFSITEIQYFKNYCYEFFYSKLVKLNLNETINLYLSKLELGNLIHKSIEDTFNLYKVKNPGCILTKIEPNDKDYPQLDLLQLNDGDKNDILTLFKSTVIERLNLYKSQHQFFNLDKLLLLGDNKTEGIMIKWFEQIIDRHINDNYYIAALEFPFRKQKTDKSLINPFFKGKIDRIDISKDCNSFRIIDYKTSDSNKDGFQLAVYSSVMQNIFTKIYGIELKLDALIFDSFRYSSEKKDTFGYIDILQKDKHKGKEEETVNDIINKEVNTIEQLYRLNFEAVKKNNSKIYTKSDIKLIKRD